MKKDTNDQTANAPNHKWRRNPLFWFAIAFIFYLIIGFLVVPPIAKGLIIDFIESGLKRPVTIGSFGFNPLTFALSIDDFYLYEPDSSVFISCQEIYVNPDVLPVINGVIGIDTIAVYAAEINVFRNPDSSFNFEDILGRLLTLTVDSLGKEKPWDLRLTRLGINHASVVFEDHLLAPDFIFGLDTLHLWLNDLHLFSQDTASWRANLKLAGGGIAEAAGTLRTDEFASDFTFRLSGFSFKPLQPILSRFAHLRIDSGTVDAFGDVHLQLDSLYFPSVLTYAGNVSSFNLSLYDLLKNENFLGWDTITTTGIFAQNNNPFTVTIAEIKAANLSARIAIEKDQSFNAVDVFQPLIQLIKSDPAILEMYSPTHFKLTVGRVAIVNGGNYFSDLSLPLQFAARVHSLNGDILNISAGNPQGARLNLKGTVDQYGYTAVRGNFDPFHPLALTDIDVVFDNIELTSLTPYSAKYAGYALESGKISLDLSYKIRDGQLQGSNQMLLNEITLGDEIKSEEATGLPVKLAIALLKDAEGNIDLDVDVTGDLNDPQINMGTLIGQAFKKAIINIASAPFRFLGNLLGVENTEELEYIAFVPGSSELPPHQEEKLIHLDKALKARPEIQLVIRGAYDMVFDTKALQKEKFDMLYFSRLTVNGKGDSTEHTLSGEILETLYREIYSDSELKQLQITHKIGEKSHKTERKNEQINQADLRGFYNTMQNQLIDAQPVSDSELNQLAQDRARTIRNQLIKTHAIPAKQVVIMESEVLEEKDDKWVNCRLGINTL